MEREGFSCYLARNVEADSAMSLQRILKKIKTRQHPLILNATAATEVPYADALYGGVIVSNLGASAATTFTLPKAVPGMRVSAVLKAAQELRLDPFGTETIALPSTGVQQAAGKYITADALSESVQLVCLIAGTWDAVGATDGTWGVEG